jgi:acyl dehydratase
MYKNEELIKTGDTYHNEFSYSQAEVDLFSKVSGDHNPIHHDAAYAATTIFKKPIIHGMLSASVFSKVFGTEFPGEGTIYLSQQLQFKRPMYVDQVYVASFEVSETDPEKHKATITTLVKHKETGDVTIQGVAQVMNLKRI